MPTGQPYGDIFSAATPALDRLGQQLYLEQKQREAQQLQNNKLLDEEFSRNMSGMWDADINDFSKKYSEYKQAYNQLQRKRSGGTPEEQLGLLKKKADMYSFLNQSKEHRHWWEEKAKAVVADKKGLFADDAQQQLVSMRGVPSSKIDRGAAETKLLYPYAVPEFDKINKESFGTLTDKRGKTVANGVTDETPVWKVGNTPNQMFEHLLGSVVSKNLGRNFTGLVLHSMSDQEQEDLVNKYAVKTQDPKFIAAYGEVQPFSPTVLSTDLGKAVALQTMKNVVDLPIPESKIEKIVNADRKMDKGADIALTRQKIMEGIKQNNRLILANVRRGWQVLDQQTQDGILDEVISGYIKDPSTIPEDILNSYKKKDGSGHIVDFNEVKISPDGQTVEMNYINDKGKKEDAFSSKANVSDLKQRTRKKIETTQTNTQHTTTPSNNKPTGKTYMYNGKTVSFDKIEKAAKQSGLSTEDYIKQFGIKQQ